MPFMKKISYCGKAGNQHIVKKRLENLQIAKNLQWVEREIYQTGEITKDKMAAEIGRALKDNGAIQFEVIEDPVNCGIIVDAKVKVVMP